MLESGWNVGGYGYFDRRRTELGSFFNQTTIGAEALGRDIDLRANGYIGIGDRRRLLNDRTAGGGTTASLVGSTVTVSVADTTRTVIEERSLSGFDAEIGWRVPMFDPEQGVNLRLYGGGYTFSADEAPDVAGPRGRLELTLDQVPGLWAGARLTLGGEVQHDDPRGTQGFVSARLRIPLGGGAEASRLSAQEHRMTDPVVRDIDVVTSGAVARSTVTAPGFVEVATATAGGQAFTILDSATTTGANLPTAITNAGAGSIVLLTGTFNTSAFIQLQAGQTVMGAGSLAVRTASGRTALLTTPTATIAKLSDPANGVAVQMAANSILKGLTISNVSNATNGIGVFSPVADAVIANNVISVTTTGGNHAHAVGIIGSNTVVRGNILSATASGVGAVAASVWAANAGNVTVAENILSSAGPLAASSFAIGGNGTPSFNAASTGNVRLSGGCLGGVVVGSVHFVDGSACP